jgi:aromatic ring-opening dioxygenase LigB subunit
MSGEIVFAAIAPHPPLLVPEVGGARIARVKASAEALAQLAARLLKANPDTVMIISPHSPGNMRRFGAFSSRELKGDFHQFGARQVSFSFVNDLELLTVLEAVTGERGIAFEVFPHENPLDHGVLVPIYYLHQAGWRGPLLALSFTALSVAEHLEFGRACRAAVMRAGRKVAFVASADLSHYLTEDGPYHFEPDAHLFDEQICHAIENNDLSAIINVDPALRQKAGECGYRSILVALGALGDSAAQPQLLSYEGPFGVGYMTAILKEEEKS